MKKGLVVLAAVLAFVGIGGYYIFAVGSGSQSSTETTIAVIGENVKMEVRPPLEVVTKWMGGTLGIDCQENKIIPLYAGQTIGNGEIIITNISPIPQKVYLSARPIQVEGDIWPAFEVVASVTDKTPIWQIVLEPGATIDLKIEVKVAYGSPISSPFRGVELIVRATPPLSD